MCAKPMYKISRILLPGYQFEKVEDVFLKPREGWKLLIGRKGKKSEEATGYDEKLLVKNPRRNVSQLHCELEFRNGRFFIYDFGSGNGTYYDGEPLKLSHHGGKIDYRRLVKGSTISLGVKDFEEDFVEDCFLFRYEEITIKAERDKGPIARGAPAGALADNEAENEEDDSVEPEETIELAREHAEVEASSIEQHLPEKDADSDFDIDFHEQATDPVIEEPLDEEEEETEGSQQKEEEANSDKRSHARTSRTEEKKATKIRSNRSGEEEREFKSDTPKCDSSDRPKKHKTKHTSRGQRLKQKRMQSASLTSSGIEESDDEGENPAIRNSVETVESKTSSKEIPKTSKSDKAKVKKTASCVPEEEKSDGEDLDNRPISSKKKHDKDTERSGKPKKESTNGKSGVTKAPINVGSSELEKGDEEELVESSLSKVKQPKGKETSKPSKVSNITHSESENSDLGGSKEQVNRSKSKMKPTKSKDSSQGKSKKRESVESDAEEIDEHRKVSKGKNLSGRQEKGRHSKSGSKGHDAKREKPHSSKDINRGESRGNKSETDDDVVSPVKNNRANRIISSSDDESDFKSKKKTAKNPYNKKGSKAFDSRRSSKRKDDSDSDDEKRPKKKKKLQTTVSEDEEDFEDSAKKPKLKSSKRSKHHSRSDSEDKDSDDRQKRSDLKSAKNKFSKRRHSHSASDDHSDRSRSRKKKRSTDDRERVFRERSSSSGSGVSGVIEEDIYVPKTKKPEAAVQLKPWELKKFVVEMLSREPAIVIRKAFETKCEGTTLQLHWSQNMHRMLNDENRETIATQFVNYIEEDANKEDQESVKQSPRYTFFYEDGVIRTKKLRNYASIKFSKKQAPAPRKQRKASESSLETSSTIDNTDDLHRSDSESVNSTVQTSRPRKEVRESESSDFSGNSSNSPEQQASFECEPGPSKSPAPSISRPNHVTIDSDSDSDSDDCLVPDRAPRQYDGAIARPSTNRKVKLIDALPLARLTKNAASKSRRQDNLENEPEPLSQAEIRRQKLREVALREKINKEKQQSTTQEDGDVVVLPTAKVRVTKNTRQDRFLEDIRRSYH